MAIKRMTGSMNVVEAAKVRLQNIFDNGVRVYFSFSGGKDSLVLAYMIHEMIRKGKIDPRQLIVVFIDEELIWPDLVEVVHDWRKKFLKVGARFDWYAMEFKHFNCFRTLEEEETFILFDRYEEERWVRIPPDFAIRQHPALKVRKDSFQDFMPKITRDGIQVGGVRVAESVQRLYYISRFSTMNRDISGGNQIWPIYDWKDRDVWLYLHENKVDIPMAYLYLWQIGMNRKQMRLAATLSVDVIGYLSRMSEYYPGLMDAIIKREPSAYLASMYWDSEMFRRNTANRKELEGEFAPKDHKKLLLELLSDIPKNFSSEAKRTIAQGYRRHLVTSLGTHMSDKHWKKAYEALIAGDPKKRTLRAIITDVVADFRGAAQDARDSGEL